MSTCCDTLDTLPKPIKGTRVLTVALAGNPNSGKTTIFNGLTGLRQKVANYPGVTVEKKTGRCKLPDGSVANIIDLPGTYSLISRSPDEVVAMEVLRGLRKETPAPDAVIVVVDASNLQRNLYLVSQLIELGRPMVIALNMMDIAERRGIRVSPQRLQQRVGVPVVPIVGHKKQGIKELKVALANAVAAPMPDWPLPEAMKEEVAIVGGALGILQDGESAFEPGRWNAVAERLLIGDRAQDMQALAQREPVASLLVQAGGRLRQLGIDPMQADIEAHYLWIDDVAADASASGEPPPNDGSVPVLDYQPIARTVSEKVDSVLIHKFWGLFIFAGIMAVLFVTIFWAAKPIMNGIQNGVGAFGTWTTHRMAAGPLKSLLTDGVFAGVGAVVVFVPQIALLFMFLAILEDSGYLARAAFLMDRILSKVGLHGKSFIPLLSSFACAIPGIMATRTMESRKDRLVTILVAPFMSCSARLPVYTLLIGTFFAAYGAWAQAGIMLACYALGIVAAGATAWVFKRTLMKGAPTSFILELPTYKIPQASQVVRQVWVNSSEFLKKAGTTIFCLSVILWAMAYYPRMANSDGDRIRQQIQQRYVAWDKAVQLVAGNNTPPTVNLPPDSVKWTWENGVSSFDPPMEKATDDALAAAQLNHSISGRLGHLMEPVLRPVGFDWKMGIGLVGAFAAREVFVSTMGITYAVGDTEENGTKDLATAMRNDRYPGGQSVWTPLVAISLLVWFVLAMQCMSTLAIVRRETGGWRWPIFMLIYMNALAYVVSLAVYQIGRLLV